MIGKIRSQIKSLLNDRINVQDKKHLSERQVGIKLSIKSEELFIKKILLLSYGPSSTVNGSYVFGILFMQT